MKRFIYRLVCIPLIAIGITAVMLIVEIWYGQKAMRNVFTIPSDVKVLCLGSSHTGCTWQEGNGVYSIWLNSSAYVFSLMRLKELERLKQLDGIKFCIVDADYGGLYENMNERWMEEVFLKQICFSWRYLNLLPDTPWKYVWVALSKFVHRRAFKTDLPRGGNFYKGLSAGKRKSLIDAVEERIRCSGVTSESIVTANKSKLEEMKRLCDAHGIHLILFAGPLVKGHPLRGSHRDLLDGWKAFCKERGVEYWDLRGEMPDELFYDIDHLSDEGRKLISKKHLSRLLEVE